MGTAFIGFITIDTSTTTQRQVAEVDVMAIGLVATHLRVVVEACTIAALPSPATVGFPCVRNRTTRVLSADVNPGEVRHLPMRVVDAVAFALTPQHPEEKKDAAADDPEAELRDHGA
jgi:hypothetical protein